MALFKNINNTQVQMTAEEETAFLAHQEECVAQIQADADAATQRATVKASAKAKLIAGEALTEAEADTIVI